GTAKTQRCRTSYFDTPAKIAFQRHREQQKLHENQTHQAHHDRIDERHLLGALRPELPLRRHEALPMAHSSSPRFSSVTRGSDRDGGPARTRPSTASKNPWWHGQYSCRSAAR